MVEQEEGEAIHRPNLQRNRWYEVGQPMRTDAGHLAQLT
jgi:hypothetical protein